MEGEFLSISLDIKQVSTEVLIACHIGIFDRVLQLYADLDAIYAREKNNIAQVGDKHLEKQTRGKIKELQYQATLIDEELFNRGNKKA